MFRRVDIHVHRLPLILAMQQQSDIPVDMNVHPTNTNLVINGSEFHVPEGLYSHKPRAGLRFSLGGLD